MMAAGQGQWAVSEMQEEPVKFDWIVKGFSAVKRRDEVKSPTFKGGSQGQYSWHLTIKPRSIKNDIEHCGLFLTRMTDTTFVQVLNARLEFKLLDREGTPVKVMSSPTSGFQKNQLLGYDMFVKSAELAQPTNRFLQDDTLRIHCSVWIEGEIKHVTGKGTSSFLAESRQPRVDNKTSLKDRAFQDFGALMRGGELADVALVTETKTFMAHKAFLGARSKVFSAMFQSCMTETSSNSVEISDFDEDVVGAMLEHMYQGQVEKMNGEKARSLLQIAEKYDLPGLKEESQMVIAKSLTVETAAETLVLAHMHNASYLKPKVIDFINRNREKVKNTEAFQRLAQTHSGIIVELYLAQQ